MGSCGGSASWASTLRRAPARKRTCHRTCQSARRRLRVWTRRVAWTPWLTPRAARSSVGATESAGGGVGPVASAPRHRTAVDGGRSTINRAGRGLVGGAAAADGDRRGRLAGRGGLASRCRRTGCGVSGLLRMLLCDRTATGRPARSCCARPSYPLWQRCRRGSPCRSRPVRIVAIRRGGAGRRARAPLAAAAAQRRAA